MCIHIHTCTHTCTQKHARGRAHTHTNKYVRNTFDQIADIIEIPARTSSLLDLEEFFVCLDLPAQLCHRQRDLLKDLPLKINLRTKSNLPLLTAKY
jgi:hypothetical protein